MNPPPVQGVGETPVADVAGAHDAAGAGSDGEWTGAGVVTSGGVTAAIPSRRRQPARSEFASCSRRPAPTRSHRRPRASAHGSADGARRAATVRAAERARAGARPPCRRSATNRRRVEFTRYAGLISPGRSPAAGSRTCLRRSCGSSRPVQVVSARVVHRLDQYRCVQHMQHVHPVLASCRDE